MLTGAIVGFPFGAILLHIPIMNRLSIVLGAICMTVLLLGRRIRTLGMLIWLVLSYATAAMLIPMFQAVKKFDWLWTWDLVLFIGLMVALVSLVFSALIWMFLHIVFGAPVIRDDFTCPTCQYSLIGNISGVCPECGTQVSLKNEQKMSARFVEQDESLRQECNNGERSSTY